MVIHAAETLLADTLMLNAPMVAADESAAALGARLRTIHLAARLATSSTVASLDALWKSCRAHHGQQRNSTGQAKGSELRFAELICAKLPVAEYESCPKGAAVPGEGGCSWPAVFPPREVVKRNGWIFAAEVDAAAKAVLLRQQVAMMSVVSNLRCGAVFHLALQPRRSSNRPLEEWDTDGASDDGAAAGTAEVDDAAAAGETDTLGLNQRLADAASARLTVTAPFYRFAIVRLLLRRNETIHTMCALYLDRLTAEVPGYLLGRVTHVRRSGEALCAEVTRLVQDAHVLLRAESAASPCVSAIAEPFLPSHGDE